MKLHNSGLCDCCGETENVGQVLINCTGDGVDWNIKDACEKLQLDFSMKSVFNDDILQVIDAILANINRKILCLCLC